MIYFVGSPHITQQLKLNERESSFNLHSNRLYTTDQYTHVLYYYWYGYQVKMSIVTAFVEPSCACSFIFCWHLPSQRYHHKSSKILQTQLHYTSRKYAPLYHLQIMKLLSLLSILPITAAFAPSQVVNVKTTSLHSVLPNNFARWVIENYKGKWSIYQMISHLTILLSNLLQGWRVCSCLWYLRPRWARASCGW